MSNSAMLKAMLGKASVKPLAEFSLPIFVIKLFVSSKDNGICNAVCSIQDILPENLKGEKLYLKGGEEGIEIDVLDVPNTKTIEFIYEGAEDIAGYQEFFTIKNYRLLPLSKWSATARAKWEITQSEIAKAESQQSPLNKVADAIKSLYRAKAAYEYQLESKGLDRKAGDQPFDLQVALTNVEIINKFVDAAEPLADVCDNYDLSAYATYDQVQAQVRVYWDAIIQVALRMESINEFESIEAMEFEHVETLYKLIVETLTADQELKQQSETSDLAASTITESDLSVDAQEGGQGKESGECTLEPPSKLPGASEELSDQDASVTIEPVN